MAQDRATYTDYLRNECVQTFNHVKHFSILFIPNMQRICFNKPFTIPNIFKDTKELWLESCTERQDFWLTFWDPYVLFVFACFLR